MWLMKVKESHKFQLFASYALDIHGEVLSFVSFVMGTNLFSVFRFTCSPEKESEKLKNSHLRQIHVQFVLFTVSYLISAMNEHSLWIHISQLSHRTAL